jgi:riboflavin synthase
MFSGIVETTALVQSARRDGEVMRLWVRKPSDFSDLNRGDSIAVDGVCLTLEEQTSEAMLFALGPETLKVTGWTLDGVKERVVNLERSLRLGDRIHGHLVTGHVDARTPVRAVESDTETTVLWIEIPKALSSLIWPKGSVTVNGVSLTVNQVQDGAFSVGLIPETLKRTNLNTVRSGSTVNLEADNLARGLVHWAVTRKEVGPC